MMRVSKLNPRVSYSCQRSLCFLVVSARGPQKDSWEGGKGVAAHSISPRPLARAREICVPTFSDRVAVSAPALMARAFAMRRQRIRAAGPSPPVVSTPKGEKSQPAAWHVALLWAFFTRSASAAADDRPSRTADEAEERRGGRRLHRQLAGGAQPLSARVGMVLNRPF